MQVCTTIQADPNTLSAALDTLAATQTIVTVMKTKAAGKFLVVCDPSGTVGQMSDVIAGDPDTLAAAINAIAVTYTIDMIINTFSASHYVVVYK